MAKGQKESWKLRIRSCSPIGIAYNEVINTERNIRDFTNTHLKGYGLVLGA